MNTGNPVEVNITGQNSLFSDGYVARYVQNGVAHSEGEGTNWKQSPLVTTPMFQDAANEMVWGQQMDQIIDQSCGCGN